MCKRILILLVVTLTAMGCARGVKPMPAPSSMVPDLSIPADLLVGDVEALPQPDSGKRSDLVANHIDVARAFHTLAIDFTALVCAITGQRGVTINGAPPVQPQGCEARAFRDVKAIIGPVDKSNLNATGPSGGG